MKVTLFDTRNFLRVAMDTLKPNCWSRIAALSLSPLPASSWRFWSGLFFDGGEDSSSLDFDEEESGFSKISDESSASSLSSLEEPSLESLSHESEWESISKLWFSLRYPYLSTLNRSEFTSSRLSLMSAK